MKFHEIIPGRLYQRGLVDARCIPGLRSRGVRTVVALTGPVEGPVRSWLLGTGGRYVHYPIPDGKKIPAALVELAAELAARLPDEPVVVHCRAGRNRSGLLTALVARQHLGISGAEALELVQQRRPNALANEHFCTYLRALPAPGKLTRPTTEVANMSETQSDFAKELLEAGLVDDETDQPQLTTAAPNDTAPEPEPEQLEMQPASADGRTWTGAEQLRPYLVRIEDLKPTPGNPDKGKTHVGRLKGSLDRFGQTRAILVDASDGCTIRAGHHLTRAADEMGWTHIAAIAAEFNDEGEAVAYLMADNQLAHVGNKDADQMAQLTIAEGLKDLEGTGITQDDLEDWRAATGTTPVIADTEPWGGEAAESGTEAAARAAALAGYEPHKEIPLYMTLPQHELFSEHVRLLQNAWGVKGVMDTILRALHECYDRAAAPVGATVPPKDETPEKPTEGRVEAPVPGDVPIGNIGEAGSEVKRDLEAAAATDAHAGTESES